MTTTRAFLLTSLFAATASFAATSCSCPSPNVRVAGTFAIQESGHPTLHPLEAQGGFLGGDDELTSCFRTGTCSRLVIQLSNLFEDRSSCAGREANPLCFDLKLTFTPGRQGREENRRLCADDARAALTIEYQRFPVNQPSQTERVARWSGGCIEIGWIGEKAHIEFDGATFQLDSGRTVDMSGEIGLHDPQDRTSC